MSELWQSLVESQIFFPERAYWKTPGQMGLRHHDVWLEPGGGVKIHGWHFPLPRAKSLMLFCHGNAGNISHRLDNIVGLLAANIEVFIFDYRGYGKSTGRPTEEGIYADTKAAWDWTREKAREEGREPVIFGRSLGGVAAVAAALEHPAGALVLESTFTNMADLAKEHFPLPIPSTWLEGRFDNLGRMGGLSGRLLFIHGDRDIVAPLALGRKLFAAAPEPKEMWVIRGADHNDTYQIAGAAYFSRLREFFERE